MWGGEEGLHVKSIRPQIFLKNQFFSVQVLVVAVGSVTLEEAFLDPSL